MKKAQFISLKERFYNLCNQVITLINFVFPIFSVFVFLIIIYNIGFDQKISEITFINGIYSKAVVIFFFGYAVRILFHLFKISKRIGVIPDLILFSFFFVHIALTYFKSPVHMLPVFLQQFFVSRQFIFLIFIVVFFMEISKVSLLFFKKGVEPPLVFAGSFLVLIFIGTALLLLPKASVGTLSLIDALFTSTSAVCVTGLIVVDTATHFTTFGKTIILILFQTGGLGIMTFTSFFGFFFRGGFSYQNQVLLKDFINEDKIGEIFGTLFKIIFFTLFVELLGAIFIFLSLDDVNVPGHDNKIFFSVFHSVSAFCNAGFSTLSHGLYEEAVRYEYSMHLVIALLIILGGLGFPIIFNTFKYFKYFFSSRYRHYASHLPLEHLPRIVNVNSKMVIYTTTVLLFASFVIYYITEYNHTLKTHSFYGKFVTAFFGAVTPRTAGFNTVDMEQLSVPLVLVYLLLMWIGASPGSTGGGIKTTTFSLAILNCISLSRAKDRVEVFGREIANESLRRAFAVIVLSFFIIGLAIFFVTFFDPDKSLLSVVFECFSAYSTVGLSLGITGDLTSESKIVIIITMFLGRVGTLTLLIGLIRNINTLNYRFPTENIFIN